MLSGKELTESINADIAKMTRLGYRTILIKGKWYRLIWSNAQCKWILAFYPLTAGEHQFDANVLPVHANKGDIQKIIENLNPLPLYDQSYEALERKREERKKKEKKHS